MAADRRAHLLSRALDAELDRVLAAPPLTGVKTPVSQRRGLTARISALEKSLGGPKAAARAAGVTPRTWNAWKTGRTPARRSLTRLDDAYKADLARRGNTSARRRATARQIASVTFAVRVTAEIQWDGYYNGQAESGPSNHSFPPLSDNTLAHRRVDFGPLDLGRVVRSWGIHKDADQLLENLLSRQFNASIFLNAYYHTPHVELT